VVVEVVDGLVGEVVVKDWFVEWVELFMRGVYCCSVVVWMFFCEVFFLLSVCVVLV